MRRAIHLLDRLASAGVSGPGGVEIQQVTLARDSRMAIFQHPPSRVRFEELDLGLRPRLRLACAIKPTVWERMAAPVRFRVEAKPQRGPRRTLLDVVLDPRTRPADRAWHEHDLDLSPFAGRRLALRFETTALGPSTDFAWAAWGDPRIEHDAPERRRVRRRRDARRHVFLVTADALGADRLAEPELETPNLDALAADGCRLAHARVQSPATLASYATLLTGRPVTAHGVSAEWGQLPEALPSLPSLLGGLGYHTLMAVSERELFDPAVGLRAHFHEAIPCLANPAQDGAVTTRQLLDWLDRRPDAPCFVWLQYFDTHPPSVPPQPFSSRYYEGDPTSPARAHRTEDVAAIRGVESVQAIAQALPLLERGIADADLAGRLRDTASVLRGETASGPDLAEHLRRLGPELRHGLDAPAFGRWLGERAAALSAAVVPPELLPWLRSVLPPLLELERDVIGWLEGVVDYRFALAEHLASVSYLDHLVGMLLDGLRERGLYDDAAVVFTSPHGEVLGTRDIHFHHHVLLEESLRVPLVLKPPAGSDHRPGSRIDGLFDSLDLLRTLLQMLELPHDPALGGRGLWPSIRDGKDVGSAPSFALASQGVMASITEPPWKLVKALAPHALSPRWSWRRGERALFDVSSPGGEETDLAARHPDVAARMERRLDAWLARERLA